MTWGGRRSLRPLPTRHPPSTLIRPSPHGPTEPSRQPTARTQGGRPHAPRLAGGGRRSLRPLPTRHPPSTIIRPSPNGPTEPSAQPSPPPPRPRASKSPTAVGDLGGHPPSPANCVPI